MSKEWASVFEKQMTRKQFLITLGVVLVGILGAGGAINFIKRNMGGDKDGAVDDDWDWLIKSYARYSDTSVATPAGDDLCRLPAYEQLALLHRSANRISAVDLTNAHLDRIHRVNESVNAFVHLTEARAKEAAEAAEQNFAKGEPRRLEGLTFAIKDLFDFWEGVTNTFGSKPFAEIDFAPPFTAIYIQRALDAGVVPLGKTNTPEFGHKGITDNLVFGPTSTPYDTKLNAGGSSGGSAAASASFMTALTQGSDAGGSVRIPAAMCGIVAHKPSVGRWPQDAPPIAYTPFFTPGPMARTTADTAMLMQVVGGEFVGDPLSKDSSPNYVGAVRRGFEESSPLKGKKIAYSPNWDIFPVEASVKDATFQALDAFRQAGATVEDATIGLNEVTITDLGGVNRRPLTGDEFGKLWVKMQSGLYGHARDLFLEFGIPIDLRERMADLTPQFAEMIQRSAEMGADEYRHLDFMRADVLHAINSVFEKYDYIVTPTLAVAGVKNDSNGNTVGPSVVDGQPVDPLIGWCLTYPTNFTGHPSMSVPAGMVANPFGGNDVPVGLQIVAAPNKDDEVFLAGAAFERFKPWYDTYPA